MQIGFQAQYDNISEGFGFLGCYRREFRHGSDILFALGQSALVQGNRFLGRTTQASLRISHTFRL